ncbi:ribosomal protein L15E [Caldisphaera lagunensis DSM 15908]|uniref:Large ribosomal subunit protein eL15 n=1 Tax=Caldisphaera lagunensis (strain DSM 15908 / JCM 11604 / ANMR 0165 / IC-154) TaxID=1056495 RepID=L0A8L4_CALLD|nr:50S ribosomal protein L15e [Caldisphaera lagunensis]AFZ70171.1 ribosomal protein L15E [Caldisphaera lagunensis DSM 15908]
MSKSMYHYIASAWKKPYENEHVALMRERLIKWRSEPTIVRVEKPTRLNRAREIGYKAKQGVIVVRVKVRKGGMRKQRPISGRRPKRMGVNAITLRKSLRLIAEERAQNRYPDLVVLGSYYVGEDGTHKWYEVILIDPSNPSIRNDKDYSWILNSPSRSGRPNRGLTHAGKKMRGLTKNRGLTNTHNHKWSKKEKERKLKKGHEASKYIRYFNTREK